MLELSVGMGVIWLLLLVSRNHLSVSGLPSLAVFGFIAYAIGTVVVMALRLR